VAPDSIGSMDPDSASGSRLQRYNEGKSSFTNKNISFFSQKIMFFLEPFRFRLEDYNFFLLLKDVLKSICNFIYLDSSNFVNPDTMNPDPHHRLI